MRKHTSIIFILIVTFLGGNYLQSADSGNPSAQKSGRALRRVSPGTERARLTRTSKNRRAYWTRHSSPVLRSEGTIKMAASQETALDRDPSRSNADTYRNARPDSAAVQMSSGSRDVEDENETEEERGEELSRWNRCKQRLGCCFKTTTGRLLGYTTAAVITLAVSVYLGNYLYDAANDQSAGTIVAQVLEGIKPLLLDLPLKTSQYVVAQVGQTLVAVNGTVHDLSSLIKDVFMPVLVQHAERTGQDLATVTEMLRNGTISMVPTPLLQNITDTLQAVQANAQSNGDDIADVLTDVLNLLTSLTAHRVEFAIKHP